MHKVGAEQGIWRITSQRSKTIIQQTSSQRMPWGKVGKSSEIVLQNLFFETREQKHSLNVLLLKGDKDF